MDGTQLNPPLSKDYLRGESEREKAYVHPAGFYEEHGIELETGSPVAAIDPGASRVLLDDNRELAYDRLLLTMGAEPRRLAVPGAELDGIHYLRTFADCDALRTRLDAGGGRVAVVGAGWIGSEFAASARSRGLEVTMIDPLALPNERIFGPEVGAFYRDVHAQHGVDMRLGRGVEAFEGDRAVRAVAVDNGIVVDERLLTSVPNIYAAGDVANAWHPFYERRIRVEHWANALNQGPAAARSMLGDEVSYERVPYFFSDQYDVGMEYSGYAERWDEVVLRGDPGAGDGFVAFWIRDERVLAGMNVNVWDVNQHVQELIRSRRAVDPRALADPDTPLDSLLALEPQ